MPSEQGKGTMLELTGVRRLEVVIEDGAFAQMLRWARGAAPNEVGGQCNVTLHEGRTLFVTEPQLVEQEVSPGAVDFDPVKFADYFKERKIWGIPHGQEWPLAGIWHSHGNSTTFMSGTDEAHLVQKFSQHGYLVNVVVNVKGECTVQVDTRLGAPGEVHDRTLLVTVPSTWRLGQTISDSERTKAELEKFIKKPTARAPGHGQGHFDGYAGRQIWAERAGWTPDPAVVTKRLAWEGWERGDYFRDGAWRRKNGVIYRITDFKSLQAHEQVAFAKDATALVQQVPQGRKLTKKERRATRKAAGVGWVDGDGPGATAFAKELDKLRAGEDNGGEVQVVEMMESGELEAPNGDLLAEEDLVKLRQLGWY